MQAVQPLLSCCAQPTWTQLNRSSTNQHVDPFVFLKKRFSSTGFKLKLYVVLHISDTTCIWYLILSDIWYYLYLILSDTTCIWYLVLSDIWYYLYLIPDTIWDLILPVSDTIWYYPYMIPDTIWSLILPVSDTIWVLQSTVFWKDGCNLPSRILYVNTFCSRSRCTAEDEGRGTGGGGG